MADLNHIGVVGWVKIPSERVIAKKFDPRLGAPDHFSLTGWDRDDMKWRYFHQTVFWWEGDVSASVKRNVDKWLASHKLPVLRHTSMINWNKYTKGNESLAEQLMNDSDCADTDCADTFWVVFVDDENMESHVGQVCKNGKWYEAGRLDGVRNWGSKQYMSYLTPKQILQWLQQDYRQFEVLGPFASAEDAEAEAANYRPAV